MSRSWKQERTAPKGTAPKVTRPRMSDFARQSYEALGYTPEMPPERAVDPLDEFYMDSRGLTS